MKYLILFFPFLIFGQEKDECSISMQAAMKDIQNLNFRNAIVNLDKSLKIVPNNWSALYFKGYSQIILGEINDGCETLIDAIYYGGNNDTKKVYAEKCIKYDPKLNAKNFKKGKFTIQILDDPLIYSFVREKNMQFETFEGKTYSGEIIWLTNGDYTIIPTDETKKIMSENPKFYTRILKIIENEYLYEKIEENQVQFGIVKKVE